MLSEIADIHKGIYYGPSLRENPERLVSAQPRPGFRPGLARVDDGFEPLVVRDHVYLNMDPNVMDERSKAYLLPWSRPKVIVNKGRLSRGPWVVTGAADPNGLVVYSVFHVMWPTGEIPIEVLAAIVNGPVANAFMSAHRTSRDNRITTLERIPVPHFQPESIASIKSAVVEYRNARLMWLGRTVPDAEMEEHCRQALLQVDAELLTAYDLPPRLERELLDYFNGYRRPGPVKVDRYYPDGFRPALPFRMFVSGELQRASASRTLERLPVLRDPAVSEMLADLE